MLSACAESEEPVQMVTPSVSKLTATDLPAELLTEIFTDDIPDNIKDVDAFLKRIEANGMKIYRGVTPNRTLLNPNYYRFLFRNELTFDETNSNNKGTDFGYYLDSIGLRYEKDRIISVLRYNFEKGTNAPALPVYKDSGTSNNGYVTGDSNENKYSIFYKVEGRFDEVPYKAIWIISFSVVDPNKGFVEGVTKCLVMMWKGTDPGRKVASVGAVRIFEDANPSNPP